MNVINLISEDNEFLELVYKPLCLNDNILIIKTNVIEKFMKNDSSDEFLLKFKEYILANLDFNNEIDNIIVIGNSKYINEIPNIQYINLDKYNNKSNAISNLEFLFNKKIKYQKNLKLPDQFTNIPKDYQNTIQIMYDGLNNIDCNKTMMMLVTGSGNRGYIYEGWSDIDLILVFENDIDQKTRDYISLLTERCNVKVGTTIYSKFEFESLLVDYKTYAAIFDMNEGRYQATIFDDELMLPKINYPMVAYKAYCSLPDMIHSMRRSTYPTENLNPLKTFKSLSHCMRVLNWIERIYPNDYCDVSKNFSILYNYQEYDTYSFLQSFIKSDNFELETKKLTEEIKKFLDFSSHYILQEGNGYVENKENQKIYYKEK